MPKSNQNLSYSERTLIRTIAVMAISAFLTAVIGLAVNNNLINK